MRVEMRWYLLIVPVMLTVRLLPFVGGSGLMVTADIWKSSFAVPMERALADW